MMNRDFVREPLREIAPVLFEALAADASPVEEIPGKAANG